MWIGHQRWRWINLPPVHTVRRTRGAEMGETATILDAAKEERCAIRKQRCPGIEHTIYPVRPVFAGQNGIGGMPMKERFGRVYDVDDQSHS